MSSSSTALRRPEDRIPGYENEIEEPTHQPKDQLLDNFLMGGYIYCINIQVLFGGDISNQFDARRSISALIQIFFSVGKQRVTETN